MARRRLGKVGATLALLLVLAGCGTRSAGVTLVTPPPNIASTTVVIQPPTQAPTEPLPSTVPTAASSSLQPPSPTPTVRPTATPMIALSPTRTATAPPPPTPTATVAPTRPPTATATKPPAATATKPPAPTATKVPATAMPGAKATSVSRGPASRRMVALTFDAGADRGFAAQILDTLRGTGVKATFGMTGKWAEQNPDLVQRMVDEGHLLMNHTYDHASFTGYSPGTAALTAEERRREIERTEAVINSIVGVQLKPWFRPPYGDYDEAMLAQLGQLGYTHSVMWTVDSLGWKGISAAEITQRCIDGSVPGAILLFHVGAASQDAAALPEIIRKLKADGYTFGTIAELLR